MYKRHLPPAHYSLKIQSFSLLSTSNADKYESGVFEAGGYNWRLSLYPNGDKDNNGLGYISLYLSIEETNKLPHGWEVDVNYKLFVYDKIRDTYLTIQDGDGAVRSFHDLKTQWGFSQFLSLETFKEASNGYLVGDSCIFGAEVFVIKSTGKWESLTMIKDPPNKTFTWKMQSFSKLDQSIYYSDAFTVGESRCYLVIKTFLPREKVYRECNLRVLDQLNDTHKERKNCHWVTGSENSWGFPDFMSLEDLHKPSKGFIYNDVLIVEVQFLVVSAVKVVGV
ncbi:uncharacterized protein LOC115689426 [Syzygium oleosum]|uniref:uncharacterized protein LOC115689426 n=1 Tax=Syzygium oleosum TaxID=219896 RepID=UPI0011D25120|nr:uncharacterized protein LOC115689426 [Syzygium oleosum]